MPDAEGSCLLLPGGEAMTFHKWMVDRLIMVEKEKD
jgi:hypothetical protein